MIGDKYLRCGKPAYVLVQHRGRSEGPYWMCEPCADHNIRNRNAEDITPGKTTDVLPASGADLDFVNKTGQAVIDALNRAAAFFRQADVLEGKALQTKQIAMEMAQPATVKEDLAIQGAIVTIGQAKKTLAEHWTVTQALHQLHRRFTARRSIAADALDAAQERLNSLHSAFVDAQQRAARQRAETEQAERDAVARQDQDRRADDLEADAIAAEAAMGGALSEREQVFVRKWVETGDSEQAATAAGFRDPIKQARRLLGLVKVQEAAGAIRTAAELRAQAQAHRDAPVVTEAVEERADVEKLDGHHDRETYSAQILDEAALINACLDGTLSKDVARTILRVHPPAVNGFARSLRMTMKWPGVRVFVKRSMV